MNLNPNIDPANLDPSVRIEAIKNIIATLDTLMKKANLSNATAAPIITLVGDSLVALGVSMDEYQTAVISMESRSN